MKLTKTILNKLSKGHIVSKTETDYVFDQDTMRLVISRARVAEVDPFFEDKARQNRTTFVDATDAPEGLAFGLPEGLKTTIKLGDLHLDKVLPAISRDITRPVLQHVRIDATSIVATDSYRLVAVKENLAAIPAGSYNGNELEIITRLYGPDTPVYVTEEGFRVGDAYVSEAEKARNLAPYPNWTQLVPTDEGIEVTLPVAKVIKHPVEKGGAVFAEINGDKIETIATITREEGKERIELAQPIDLGAKRDEKAKQYQDDIVRMNQSFFADVTKAFEGLPVTISWTGAFKPVKFDNGQVTALLMPIRVA